MVSKDKKSRKLPEYNYRVFAMSKTSLENTIDMSST